ncbi:NUDIX domain-containing protein [Herbiconiux sp. VKM Ac-1786]|uniref:NUDIX domain-containing protein n=1 Tax=Herbiconiux sp. VKM Ac-1786 TaxID=2783824 RepID=UPI00188BC292|nr:NUDIX domain-containing protein [Herbiconiux sp. VKM Ac-1786]MBF4571940.1 NUDIX domain-containing protein [Herbiconiux sp. VKM Ac-1786]
MRDRTTRSAGILPYRRRRNTEVYLGHMGGPFWARKDRSWSIVKGLIEGDEDALDAARREFLEETGNPIAAPLEPLGEFRQPSGKLIIAFVADVEELPPVTSPGTFELEWPPRSGRVQTFPEIDDARWFDLDAAGSKLVLGQLPILDAVRRLNSHSAGRRASAGEAGNEIHSGCENTDTE